MKDSHRWFRRFAIILFPITAVGCGTTLPKDYLGSSSGVSESEHRSYSPSADRLAYAKRTYPNEPYPIEGLRLASATKRLPSRKTGSEILQVADAVPVTTVDDLVRIAVAQNPRLGKASFTIESAQGKYVQAGLYPNPVFIYNADELGDKTGPAGIHAPTISQEIVTAGKLRLSQAIAMTEVNQANLSLLGERYAVIGSVRSAYYDLYALEQRIVVLDQLVKLAEDAAKNGKILFDKEQIAKLDYIQFDVELERYRAKATAAKRELPAARKRLAALVGDHRLNFAELSGPFEELPIYSQENVLQTVLTTHPEVRIARVGVDKAQATIRRAQAEVTPNVTVSSGYTYQGQNRSHDWQVGLSTPLMIWNRNQGNIFSAKAELGVALQEMRRVENDLTDRVSVALRTFSSASQEAKQYRTEILPRAEESYRLSVIAFKGGQFEYLRVIQAQRTIAEAKLDYNRALSEAWKAASELSGYLLEEQWPLIPAPLPMKEKEKE